MIGKRGRGQYYTVHNPFNHPAFSCWAAEANIPETNILEPYAGANSLIRHLTDISLCKKYSSFDIEPGNEFVKAKDTLKKFPKGFDVCVTNPPWLARNSATVRGIPYPECEYDNLYKYALRKCLDHCPYVAALVPESFIRASLFQDRLVDFVSLTSRLFPDTGHPVGLAMFCPEKSNEVRVWSDGVEIGLLSDLEKLRPVPRKDGPAVRFNARDGNVGLLALDNTYGPSIRFCDVRELDNYVVKSTGRHITKIHVDGSVKIKEWNNLLTRFRNKTHDVLLTCYKGIRKDGKYRRRLDWSVARGIVHYA